MIRYSDVLSIVKEAAYTAPTKDIAGGVLDIIEASTGTGMSVPACFRLLRYDDYGEAADAQG